MAGAIASHYKVSVMSNKGLSPAEEEAIIRERFLTGASVGRGEPPFKKLIKRFVELVDRVENASPEAAEHALKAFLRETTAMELQASKYAAVCSAQRKEQESYVEKQQQLQEHIEQAMRDIEDKKNGLEEARVLRQHMEEYEVLRGMVSELPSRASTQSEIDRINRHMDRIEAEGKKYAAVVERKRRQYALLFHVLDELQRDDAEAAGPPPAAAAAAGDAAAAMEVDG